MLNFSKNLNNSTYLVKICPLCKTKKSKSYKYCYKNRYTEEFSNLLKVHPEYLMKNVKQRTCPKCSFLF